VEAGPGQFITVNPGEVHDGRPASAAPRAWRILYFAPDVFGALRADVSGSTREPRLVAPVFAEPALRGAFERAFACARDGVAPLRARAASPPGRRSAEYADARRPRARGGLEPLPAAAGFRARARADAARLSRAASSDAGARAAARRRVARRCRGCHRLLRPEP